MRLSRLSSAATVLLLLSVGVTALRVYTARTADGAVHALAPQMFPQKNQGRALQRAAFRQPDLLPIYGSSELNLRNAFHASALFRSYPTGFSVFPVGNLGSTSLIWLQALAAVGADLRGKRVALSFSPRAFFSEQADRHAYAANFSRLHASELAFSSELSLTVKQAAARQMLAYPETLVSDPLLAFALARLAGGSNVSRALYYLILPLGKVHQFVLRLQDDGELVRFVRAQLGLAAVTRNAIGIDWTRVGGRAQQDAQRSANNNPFGFDNTFWTRHAAEIATQKQRTPLEATQRNLEQSAEWTDLSLALQVIRELGGQPLVLSLPMNAAYYDFIGVPAAMRQMYHARLRELTTSYGAALVDFADNEEDKSFTIDTSLHMSSTGWWHYNRALDAFFHGRDPNSAS